MSIYFNKAFNILNELKVTKNGVTSNVDQDGNEAKDDSTDPTKETDSGQSNVDTGDDTNNAPEDNTNPPANPDSNTLPEDNAQDANQSELDNDEYNLNGDENSDPTKDTDDTGSELDNADADAGGETVDGDTNPTADTDDTGSELDNADADAGDGTEGGDETDPTADTDDASSDLDGATDDTGDGTGDSTDAGTTDDTSTDADQPSDLQTQEKDEVFKSLTPEQLEIKNKELKSIYIDLYNMVLSISDRVNSIPKNSRILKPMEFVSEQLNQLQELIPYYLNNTFDTKTYIENSINYQEYLTVINTIKKLLDEITPKN